jgi:hypothetical protein
MCPTLLGRVETRTFTLLGPAILGAIISIATGNEGFVVVIGILLLEGVALDLAFYPFVIRWQPPWLTFVLAVGEFVILYTLSQILEVGLSPAQAIWFYWLSWAIAIATKIAVLPIVSLSWIENGGEFRFTGWSVTPENEPVPLLAEVAAASPGEIRLVREFSTVNEIPADLRGVPAPSGIHRQPEPVPEKA